MYKVLRIVPGSNKLLMQICTITVVAVLAGEREAIWKLWLCLLLLSSLPAASFSASRFVLPAINMD